MASLLISPEDTASVVSQKEFQISNIAASCDHQGLSRFAKITAEWFHPVGSLSLANN